MKSLTFEQIIALLQRAEQIKKLVIIAERKQKPFAEIKGQTIRTEICVN